MLAFLGNHLMQTTITDECVQGVGKGRGGRRRGGRSHHTGAKGVAKDGWKGRRGHFLKRTPSDAVITQPGWPPNPNTLPLPLRWRPWREEQSSTPSLQASGAKISQNLWFKF